MLEGPSKYVYQKTLHSLESGKLCDLLCGYGEYSFPHLDRYPGHDTSGMLYSGIYKIYKSNENVKTVFEDSLIRLSSGNLFELMIAFNYIWTQRGCELRGTAPFTLTPTCIQFVSNQLQSRRADLGQYKEHIEFGSDLPGGAWEYILNVNRHFIQDYNTPLFSSL